MGWGRTLFLGDIGNRLDIEDCEREIQRLKKNLWSQGNIDRSQDATIARLESENNEMKLYVAALIRLLMAKGLIEADEIVKLVHAIDSEDGSVDGRMDGPLL